MKLSSRSKVIIPIITLFVLYALLFLLPGNDIGSFNSVRASGEINQRVKILVDSEKGFERNQNGLIKSFYARDKHNALAKVSLEEPASDALMNAQIVEIFGHMHGDVLVGKSLTIVK
ncbi:MAG: hypothetical protein KDH95_04170 [Calditrichaeota bacterium]|nr:hypothetical protein [Calditrichota bacterium]MCB0267343.1 hypothetical protein [Calditrichota bacterium]